MQPNGKYQNPISVFVPRPPLDTLCASNPVSTITRCDPKNGAAVTAAYNASYELDAASIRSVSMPVGSSSIELPIEHLFGEGPVRTENDE